MKVAIFIFLSLFSFIFISCPAPYEEIEYSYKRNFSFSIENKSSADCKVTAVRLNNRSNASGEWEDFFNFVPNKKDSVAVVKAGETAIIDDFPLDTIEYVEPWYESFFLKINDDFYLGSPKRDKYSENLGIEKSKIKEDNLHWVKITASQEKPSIEGSLEANEIKGFEEGKIYRNFSESISVTINEDSVIFSLDAVEF